MRFWEKTSGLGVSVESDPLDTLSARIPGHKTIFDRDSAWQHFRRWKLPKGGQCIPDILYPPLWRHPPGTAIAEKAPDGKNDSWDKVDYADLHSVQLPALCKCIGADEPTLSISRLLLASIPNATAKKQYINKVAGAPGTQMRVDYCWTKAFQWFKFDKDIPGTKHDAPGWFSYFHPGAKGKFNNLSHSLRMGGDVRAYNFPNPCKFIPEIRIPCGNRIKPTEAQWEALLKERRKKPLERSACRSDREGNMYRHVSHTADKLMVLSKYQRQGDMPVNPPARCSEVQARNEELKNRRAGYLRRAEKEPRTNRELFEYSRGMPDQAVRVLDDETKSGFRVGSNTHPNPGGTSTHIERLNLLELQRKKSKRHYNTVAGLGRLGVTGLKAQQNLMIAGTAAGTLGLFAFIYIFTKAK